MSLRIGLVTTSYPREPGDPAGSFVKAHVDAMRALGHDVEVINAHDIGGSPLFEGSGAPEALERGDIFAQAKAMLEGARFTAELTTAIYKRIHDWDVIIAHWLPCAAAAVAARQALIAARSTRKIIVVDATRASPTRDNTRLPILAIAHGGDVHTLRRTRLLAPTLKTLEVAGAKLAFVSDELRQLAGAGADAIVQPMGVDLEHFAQLARTPTTPPTIAVIGRLVPIKGIDVAIDAMTHVGTRARLVIGGDGPERAALEARAEKIESDSNSPRVHFAGQLDPAARDDLLGRASLVVIPSRVLPNGRSEGTPLVALEALAAGVPVVASDVGGLRELARGSGSSTGTGSSGSGSSGTGSTGSGSSTGSGGPSELARGSFSYELGHPFRDQPQLVTLVPPDDPRALAAAIDRVLAWPAPSEQLRATVAHLDWPRVAQRLLDFALGAKRPLE